MINETEKKIIKRNDKTLKQLNKAYNLNEKVLYFYIVGGLIWELENVLNA
jgi:hypothetical protein